LLNPPSLATYHVNGIRRVLWNTGALSKKCLPLITSARVATRAGSKFSIAMAADHGLSSVELGLLIYQNTDTSFTFSPSYLLKGSGKPLARFGPREYEVKTSY